MSTALSVIPVNTFQAFDPTSRAARALMANTEGRGFSQQDLIQVKTPAGGGQFWEIQEPSGAQAVPEITGLLVFYARQGVLWPSSDPSSQSKPIIVTRDWNRGTLQAKATRDENGVITDIEGTPPEMVKELAALESPVGSGNFDWKALPYTQFGSGKNRTGKFAKEKYLLFILRQGSVLPIVVHTGPSAIKGIGQFLTQLEYPYWQAMVGITLKVEEAKGVDDSGRPNNIKYSLAKISLKSVISDEDADIVHNRYTASLKSEWERGGFSQTEIVD